jgi:hypothetical protein
MTLMTRKEIQRFEEYYYWSGYKNWYPFPEELKEKLLSAYGKEPIPYSWTEQDIWEGSRKIIIEYFSNKI